MFLFLRKSDSPEIDTKPETNIPSSLEFCMEDSVYDAIRTVSLQGGTLELENYLESKNVEYLCYHPNPFSNCMVRNPFLVNHVENEIGEFLFFHANSCLNITKINLEKKGYEMSFDLENVSIELSFENIAIKINGKVVLVSGDETSIEKDYEFSLPTRIYDLLITVQDLVYEESQFCDFDYELYNKLYHQFEINQTLIENAKFYEIKDVRTNEEFKFAVRGC
jgi:hypothetical protein